MKLYTVAGYLILSSLVLLPRTDAAPFFVGVYVIPPPDQPEIDVRIDFVDADSGDYLGGITKHIKGSHKITETLTPEADTKRVTIKFEPLNINNYRVKPAERTMELSPKMEASSVTWIASIADDKAYLDNVTTAGSVLKKKDADGAIARAAYAGAVATTANQRLEAARVEAQANAAKGDWSGALAVYDKVVTEGFEKADEAKKQVFVGEWLDTLEAAARHDGAEPSRVTGLTFPSLKADSPLRGEFEKLSQVFAEVIPRYKNAIANLSPADIAQKERIMKAEWATVANDLRRRSTRGR